MASSQPLVCVFLKLPPSYRTFSRIYEIAWNEFLPQLNRLNHAFEAAQAAYPSSEAKKIWSETRKAAADKMIALQNVSFKNYNAASAFLQFLNALHRGKYVSETCNDFQVVARGAVGEAGITQEVIIQFREDLRIAVGQITAIMSDGDSDNKDISSFVVESNQSILEIATAVEECGALLEEFRNEFKGVQQQNSDDKDNPPSDEEFQMVQGKWQAFYEIAGRLKRGWAPLKDEMRGYLEGDDLPLTPPNNPASPTMPPNPHRVPSWRKFFRRACSALHQKQFLR